MATEGTKFQINYKLADGTLINLYAKDVKDLETGLADLAMNAANIRMTGGELTGYIAPPTEAPTVAAVAQAFNATPVAQPVAVQSNGQQHQCRHGVMTYREGVNAQGKPWKGYLCAAPKGATDKCDAIWVR
jgi:hypothetical protein